MRRPQQPQKHLVLPFRNDRGSGAGRYTVGVLGGSRAYHNTRRRCVRSSHSRCRVWRNRYRRALGLKQTSHDLGLYDLGLWRISEYQRQRRGFSTHQVRWESGAVVRVGLPSQKRDSRAKVDLAEAIGIGLQRNIGRGRELSSSSHNILRAVKKSVTDIAPCFKA
ncbi:hypothetical protein PIB30_068713 [Stylosanthes scabra]|uniref:Uncharacterized protein n=1 Tax=Stylosanthes scabra TaxID=79078 RepID=A0ABU6VMG3_9FABA|nr:hypothetical protein [Stylosanthes scabra]